MLFWLRIFIETYAKSVDNERFRFLRGSDPLPEPVDLGTRCTVFMNSKVKQGAERRATIGGLSPRALVFCH